MQSTLHLISDAIAAEAQAIRYACGLSRSYMMATLATELLEARAYLKKQEETSADEVRELLDNLNEVLEQSTSNHALMVTNRLPEGGEQECEMLCPGFRYSALTYADASAPTTEQRLCEELLRITRSEDLPDFPVKNIPFPLCELVVTLTNQVRWLCEQRFMQLNYTQQRLMAEDNNPQLAEYINRTIEAGLMTSSGQWEANVTRGQIAYWINLASFRLRIGRPWKWARERWGIDKLAQDQNKNISGKYIPHRQVIDQIFE